MNGVLNPWLLFGIPLLGCAVGFAMLLLLRFLARIAREEKANPGLAIAEWEARDLAKTLRENRPKPSGQPNRQGQTQATARRPQRL